MVTLYWVFEYAKVFFGYIFLMFIWPSVIFQKMLKRKSITYRFSFCCTVSLVIINFFVLFLGLLHILNKWVVFAALYGLFFGVIIKRLQINLDKVRNLYYVTIGVYGIKSLLYKSMKKWRLRLKKFISECVAKFCMHPMEYIVLFVMILFGMIYFSYGAFQEYSYGISDMYLHHQWIYEMTEGNIFPNGVYPQAMHCFIYCMHILLGIKVYSCVLFLGCIHLAVIILCAYCFLREIFKSRYTPLFVLAMFLTLDLLNSDMVLGMSRLQWTLPQEFGWHSMFLCALYFIRYLKYSHFIVSGKRKSNFCWDENLILFFMSFAASVAIHFHAVFLIVLVCISALATMFHKILMPRYFVPLTFVILCGAMSAALPMVIAYSNGAPFQISIQWTMNIVDDNVDIDTDEDESIEDIDEREHEPAEEKESDKKIRMESVISLSHISRKNISHSLNQLLDKLSIIYKDGYTELYGTARAVCIMILTGCIFGLWCVFQLLSLLFVRMVPLVINKIKKRKYENAQIQESDQIKTEKPGYLYSGIKLIMQYLDSYMILALSSFLLILLYVFIKEDIVRFMRAEYICAMVNIFILSVAAVPFDILFAVLALVCRNYIMQILSAVCAAGIYVLVNAAGCFHGYLFFNLSRYDSVVMVTESIINTLPKYSYTIVSPTEELYQTIQNGRHEELITFIKKSSRTNYTIPTEYIFVYVEKRPIEYPQMHFFNGPSWIAEEKYSSLKGYDKSVSRYPDINAEEISDEVLQEDISRYPDTHDVYTDIKKRTVIESLANDWCSQFLRLYPFEMDVYYEDEDFVCYYFKQGPGALYDLAIR